MQRRQSTLAVDYAYRVLRAHTSEIEAHKAYLGSLTPGARPDIPATMDKVEVGSAVQYSENSDAPAGWFVIEDTDKPSNEFEEIPASGDIANELLGKKVGDTFVRVKSPLKNRVGKIKSTVVLDLVALTTLRLLGITRQALTSGRFRFVVSAATYTELQELRAKARFSTPHGTMYYKDGQHYMTQTTEEQSEREKAEFEEWMRCVESNTTVVSVPEVAALDPERRKVLEKAFGWEGLDAAVAALAPGSILWTDDLVFAEYAKSDVGVERVWTQAVVEYLATRGLIDRAVAEEAFAKLVGFNYQATHFRGSAIVAALRVSNGSIDAFPMRQMIQAFAPLAASTPDRKTAFLMLGEFILKLSIEPFLPETKCVATKALLDTFPTDAATKAQLAVFSVQCGNAMKLNPVGQADFLRCFDQWKKEKLTL